MKEARESSHNKVAVRNSYERALELFNMIVRNKDTRSALHAMASETAYKSTKDAGHMSGMPAKCWKNIIMGTTVDDMMNFMFGDPDAGKPIAKIQRKVSVRRSLDVDDEEQTATKKKTLSTKKSIKKAVVTKVVPRSRKK
jgi:hypothetical protein